MGTRENRLEEAVLTSTHNLCFEQKYEKHQTLLSENFQFLLVKFSIYLNRRVFVMKPHFYIVKLGFTVVYIIFFLFLLKNIDCGYSLEPPHFPLIPFGASARRF